MFKRAQLLGVIFLRYEHIYHIMSRIQKAIPNLVNKLTKLFQNTTPSILAEQQACKLELLLITSKTVDTVCYSRLQVPCKSNHINVCWSKFEHLRLAKFGHLRVWLSRHGHESWVEHPRLQVVILKLNMFAIAENDFLRDKHLVYKKVFAKQPLSWTFCSTLRCSCHIKRWQWNMINNINIVKLIETCYLSTLNACTRCLS